MAEFLIETGDTALQLEEAMMIECLSSQKYAHSYELLNIAELNSYLKPNQIPVGSIDFVTRYLSRFYLFDKENPIEIPVYLRTEEFLKRLYKIVDWTHIPRNSKFFLKDVSQLKRFGEVVDTTWFDIDEIFNYVKQSKCDNTLVLDKTHLFQVSECLAIKAEYRVYVIDGVIENVAYYNGDCTLFPDMTLIRKAVGLIAKNEEWLKSYTIDIAITNRGTVLLEIHNFASVGLYSTLWGHKLVTAYRQGIDYLLNDNREIERTEG